MEILVAALDGSFAEVMRRLVALVGRLSEEYPVAADLVQHMYEELLGEVGDKLTPDQLMASVKEVLAIIKGLEFGPPNPGAVAVQ